MISPTFRRFLVVALCAGIAFMAGCAHEKSVTPPKKPRSLFVDQAKKTATADKSKDSSKLKAAQTPKLTITQQGVTLNWTQKDGTQMTASAKSGDFNEETQVGTLLDFSAKLYENGKLTATLSAPRAIADTAKHVVLATGGVALKSLTRRTFVKASWIKWYANKNKIVGNGGVTIKSTNGSVTGAAFVADTSLKTLTVKDSGSGLEF